jgi:hypothetical protein
MRLLLANPPPVAIRSGQAGLVALHQDRRAHAGNMNTAVADIFSFTCYCSTTF